MKCFIASVLLIVSLLLSGNAFADNAQPNNDAEYTVVETNETAPASGSKRILLELGVGFGFSAAAHSVLTGFVIYPLWFGEAEVAFDYVNPIFILSVAGAVGGGVHLGGRLGDNVGHAWTPYVGAFIGAVIPLSLELSRHFYNRTSMIGLAMQLTAYYSVPFFALFGSVLACELSHAREKSKQDEAFALMPYIGATRDSRGKTFNTVGLSVIF